MALAIPASDRGRAKTSRVSTPRSAMLTFFLTDRCTRRATAQTITTAGSIGMTPITSPLPTTGLMLSVSHSCAMVAGRATMLVAENMRTATATTTTRSTATPCGISTAGSNRRSLDCCTAVDLAGAGACGFGRRRRAGPGRECGLLFVLIVINCATPGGKIVGGTTE